MARPRKTVKQLIASNARAGVIAKRRLEESNAVEAARPLPRPELLNDLRAALALERATFTTRILPGQTVALEFGNVRFNWRTTHPLSIARKFAEQVAKSAEKFGPVTQRFCKRFLADLTNGHERGFYIDPCAAESLPLWLALKRWDCDTLAPMQLLCPVQIVAWKKANGEYRFNDLWWDCSGEFEPAIRAGMRL